MGEASVWGGRLSSCGFFTTLFRSPSRSSILPLFAEAFGCIDKCIPDAFIDMPVGAVGHGGVVEEPVKAFQQGSILVEVHPATLRERQHPSYLDAVF